MAHSRSAPLGHCAASLATSPASPPGGETAVAEVTSPQTAAPTPERVIVSVRFFGASPSPRASPEGSAAVAAALTWRAAMNPRAPPTLLRRATNFANRNPRRFCRRGAATACPLASRSCFKACAFVAQIAFSSAPRPLQRRAISLTTFFGPATPSLKTTCRISLQKTTKAFARTAPFLRVVSTRLGSVSACLSFVLTFLAFVLTFWAFVLGRCSAAGSAACGRGCGTTIASLGAAWGGARAKASARVRIFTTPAFGSSGTSILGGVTDKSVIFLRLRRVRGAASSRSRTTTVPLTSMGKNHPSTLSQPSRSSAPGTVEPQGAHEFRSTLSCMHFVRRYPRPAV
mmetsp:Transcript_74628/g.216523  ORF Transcript_74628/g.216523 Transcript_74628/m.216523 type:complete len:343 (+) Transcript_74628:1203-2231(+)